MKNAGKIICNILGAILIGFGLMCLLIQFIYGIGAMIIGLLLLSPVRNKVVSSTKLQNKHIYIIWILVGFALMVIGSAFIPQTEIEQEKSSSEPKIIEVESVDILYEESDRYLDKKIKITGPVNISDASVGDMLMYGIEDAVAAYLEGSEEYVLPDTGCATVTGVVKLGEYEEIIIDVEKFKECTNENCSHNDVYYDEGITFEEKVDACIKFDNMNWSEFYQYPDTYDDGSIYYIVGKVIHADGVGGGLLRLVDGDNRTIVEFTTAESEHIYENEVIALFGTVSSGGEYINNDNGQTYSCPYFYAEECMRGEYEYGSAAELSEEEYDLIFGNYEILYGYSSDDFGSTIKLTENTISGHPYTIKTLKLTYGTTLISSYSHGSNSLKYMMVINVDVDGEEREVYLFFRLDGDVEIDDYDCERLN